VKPEWILDSIKQRKLLKYDGYRLLDNVDPQQPKISFPKTVGANEQVKNGTVNASNKFLKSNGELDLRHEQIRNKICTAPGFIKSYFATSRLHHLSGWKQELIRFVDQKMKSRGKGEICAVTKNSIIMHVDMDCFFVSVALRERQDLVSLPVAVSHASGSNDSSLINSTSDIASCNYIARSFGVKNGISVGSMIFIQEKQWN
jgi:DNA repair protein REV1